MRVTPARPAGEPGSVTLHIHRFGSRGPSWSCAEPANGISAEAVVALVEAESLVDGLRFGPH